MISYVATWNYLTYWGIVWLLWVFALCYCRTVDAKPPDPFSFFGASDAHQHHGFHQPWNVKLEPIDVDDSYRSCIPADTSGNDPRIKERLLRKDQPVSYVAPHERAPPVLLEYPRIAYFSLDVQDSSSNPSGDKISVDCDRGVTANGDYGCFEPDPAAAEEGTRDLVLSSASSSLNLLSAKDGAPDEVKTARHLSLPIMQIIGRGSADKFTRLKRGNGILAPDSPALPSASS